MARASVFFLLALLPPFFVNCSGFATSTRLAESNSSTSGVTPGGAATPVNAASLGSELVANGDFRESLKGWADFGGTLFNADVNTNSFPLLTIGPSAGGLAQTVSVQAGRRYRLSAFARTEAGNGGAQMSYSMTLPDASSVNGRLDFFSSDDRQMVMDFDVPAGVTSVYINVWSNAGTGTAGLSQVSLREVIKAPEPITLVDEGDSISVAPHSLYYSQTTPGLLYFNDAVGGSAYSDIVKRQPNVVAHRPANGRFIVTMLIGANDLAGFTPTDYAEKIYAYCDFAHSTGAKIAVSTVLPQAGYSTSADVNSKRAVLNALLRTTGLTRCDALIDYDSDAILRLDETAADKTYFIDGLHPTWGPGGGQERMFRVYKAVVDTMMARF